MGDSMPQNNPKTLYDLFKLAPDQAIKWFGNKGNQKSWNWFEVWQEQHAKAFTVAKSMSFDILADVRQATEQALKQGLTSRQYRSLLTNKLKAKGWWGKKDIRNPNTGVVQKVQLGSPWRLNTIYQTNMQSSMMSGRWKAFYDNRKKRPFLQYIAVLDSITRKSHAALHGKIFPIGDPIWNSIYPPNGFQCRCRVRALTEKQAVQRGYNSNEKYKVPDDFPDNGFSHNNGIGQIANDIKTWKSLYKVETSISKKYTPKFIDELMKIGVYTAFIDRAYNRNKAIGDLVTTGYMSNKEFDVLKNHYPSLDNGALVFSDSLIVGKKAIRHSKERADRKTGKPLNPDQLSIADWKALPLYYLHRKAVYLDKSSNDIIVIMKSRNDSRYIKMVYKSGDFYKFDFRGGSIRTAFYTENVKVYGKDSNKYELIYGKNIE
jgi:SPP1 gp7 family putative phage head morphogenesis protein